ncbi:sulfotransferase [Methylophaga sp.]|uniref:sulfotransferase n=1 Tax=Methylophaga sp. TaxID=2024840 RepID=UPI0013FF930C|nr:sulfotransferase [Methylophaga sp.]MTI64678.1 sulfotransferase [Methylophaga sp.]
MKLSEHRTPQFRRNILLEELLTELNADLELSEEKLISSNLNQEMPFPLILVMGPLRSGTTLFTQWLANTDLVAYPTNLLSRFYQAPILGSKIQLLLTDPRFNFRDELGEFAQQAEYRSENGKTKGVLAPNEFWYFWRRFLSEPQRDIWSDEELKQSMDIATMRAELIGMMNVFQQPFATKGMLFNYNIPFLNSILEKVVFVQIKRDPVSNVASVLDARKRQLGSESQWYSFQIPEYEALKDLDPITQVSGQIHHINNAVDNGISSVDESRKLVVQYEEFCENPKYFFDALAAKLGLNNPKYNGPSKFELSRTNILNAEQISAALKSFK